MSAKDHYKTVTQFAAKAARAASRGKCDVALNFHMNAQYHFGVAKGLDPQAAPGNAIKALNLADRTFKRGCDLVPLKRPSRRG